MAGEETTSNENITNNYNAAQTGLNMETPLVRLRKAL